MPLEVNHSTKSLRGILLLLFFLVVMGSIPASSQSTKWKQWAVKGDTLYAREDFKGAIEFYDKAIRQSRLKDKDAFKTVYKRAVCYFSIEKYPEALKDIELFSTEFPNVPQASLLKAFIYREIDDDERQLTNLQAAMDMDEPGPDLLKWRALLFMKAGQYGKAKTDLLSVRGMQDDPETESFLGLCYYNLQKKDSAFLSFNTSIEMDATYMPAYLYVGSLTLEEGDYPLSLKYLNLALRIEPSNKEVLYYKGVALVEMEKIEEGCKCLNRAFYAGMDDAGDYLEEHCFGNEN